MPSGWTVAYEQYFYFAIWEGRLAMLVAERGYLAEECLGHERSKLASHGDIFYDGDEGGAVGEVGCDRLEEVFVHGHLVRMGVEIALGQFDGLAYHDAHGDFAEAELGGFLERLANEVAIMHHAQARPHLAQAVLTLLSRHDAYLVASDGACHLEFAAYALHEGLVAQGRHDARCAYDAYATEHAHLGVECLLRQGLSVFHAYHHVKASGAYGAYLVCDHLARSGVDGRPAHGDAKAGERDHAHPFALEEMDAAIAVGRHGRCDPASFGDVGVVARVFHHGSASSALDVDGYAHRLSVGKGEGDLFGAFVVKKREERGLGGGCGACSCGEACAQREKAWRKLLDGPAQAVGACDVVPMGGQLGVLDNKHFEAERQGCLHLSLISAALAALFGDDGVAAQLPHHLFLVVRARQGETVVVENDAAWRKALLFGYCYALGAMKDAEDGGMQCPVVLELRYGVGSRERKEFCRGALLHLPHGLIVVFAIGCIRDALAEVALKAYDGQACTGYGQVEVEGKRMSGIDDAAHVVRAAERDDVVGQHGAAEPLSMTQLHFLQAAACGIVERGAGLVACLCGCAPFGGSAKD